MTPATWLDVHGRKLGASILAGSVVLTLGILAALIL